MKIIKKVIFNYSDFFKTAFGNVIEWFDFAIYSLLSTEIAKYFFPFLSPKLNLLVVFLSFGIGFIARPLGSLIFGIIGDRFGKRFSINIAIWCMVVPTMLIGLLPTYKTIGFIAPLLLTCLRFLQGISAGGQFPGLITIAVEKSPENRSFFACTVHAIAVSGGLLASFVILINLNFMAKIPALATFYWRIPFLSSSLLFLIYLYCKPETEKHISKVKVKLATVFKQQPIEVLYIIILSTAMGSLYYIFFTYYVIYMQIHLNFSQHTSLKLINIAYFCSIIFYLLFGKIADLFKSRILLGKAFTISLIPAVYQLFMNSQHNIMQHIWLIISIALFCGLTSCITSLYCEIFDKVTRMTTASISFSLGVALAGFSPFICEILVGISRYGIFIFALFFILVIFLLLILIPKTKGFKNFNQANF